MRELIAKIIIQLLALGSVIRLYFALPASEQSETSWRFGVLFISLILVASMIWEVTEYFRSAPALRRAMAALLRNSLSRGDNPTGGKPLPALVLAREHENRVAFGDMLDA